MAPLYPRGGGWERAKRKRRDQLLWQTREIYRLFKHSVVRYSQWLALWLKIIRQFLCLISHKVSEIESEGLVPKAGVSSGISRFALPSQLFCHQHLLMPLEGESSFSWLLPFLPVDFFPWISSLTRMNCHCCQMIHLALGISYWKISLPLLHLTNPTFNIPFCGLQL